MDKMVHFEIPADDLARAQKFYESIFGWDIKLFPMPDMEYYGVTTVPSENGIPKEPGAINGGMVKRQTPEETPTLVINVADVAVYCQKVESAGGKVVAPTFPIGDFGLYAKVQDTEGNVIGLWQDVKKS